MKITKLIHFNNNNSNERRKSKMEARVKFTDEFRKKAEQGLSAMEKGRLRWKKLEEAEANGTLALAKSRYDIGNLVGLPNDQSAYSWVSGLISRGAIAESFAGEEDGIYIHSYKLAEAPSFRGPSNRGSAVRRRRKKNTRRYSNGQSTRERGKTRYARLRAISESGLLDDVTNRDELIRALALQEPKKKLYSWISNMKSQGYLIEEIGTGKYGQFTCKYKLADKRPAYADEPIMEAPVEKATQVVLNHVDSEPVVMLTPKVTIEHSGTKVTMEQCEANFVVEVLKGLASNAQSI